MHRHFKALYNFRLTLTRQVFLSVPGWHLPSWRIVPVWTWGEEVRFNESWAEGIHPYTIAWCNWGSLVRKFLYILCSSRFNKGLKNGHRRKMVIESTRTPKRNWALWPACSPASSNHQMIATLVRGMTWIATVIMCVRISSTLLFHLQDELTLQSRMIHAISSFSFQFFNTMRFSVWCSPFPCAYLCCNKCLVELLLPLC